MRTVGNFGSATITEHDDHFLLRYNVCGSCGLQELGGGLTTARAHGRVGGRPTVVTPDTLAAAKARQQRGETPTQIAKFFGVSPRATIYRHLNP